MNGVPSCFSRKEAFFAMGMGPGTKKNEREEERERDEDEVATEDVRLFRNFPIFPSPFTYDNTRRNADEQTIGRLTLLPGRALTKNITRATLESEMNALMEMQLMTHGMLQSEYMDLLEIGIAASELNLGESLAAKRFQTIHVLLQQLLNIQTFLKALMEKACERIRKYRLNGNKTRTEWVRTVVLSFSFQTFGVCTMGLLFFRLSLLTTIRPLKR
jgi:hypothetical protein